MSLLARFETHIAFVNKSSLAERARSKRWARGFVRNKWDKENGSIQNPKRLCISELP